jgi:hypothetical protein
MAVAAAGPGVSRVATDRYVLAGVAGYKLLALACKS